MASNIASLKRKTNTSTLFAPTKRSCVKQKLLPQENAELLDHWLVIIIALGYLLLLFAIAEYGERFLDSSKPRPLIYSLSLAVYCTSWAMFGTVDQAEDTGWFLAPTYFGSIILFVFAWPILIKIIRIAKQNKVTSIADFIAGRFGRSHLIGGLVVTLCLVAIVPYISLQLKAIVNSYLLISGGSAPVDVAATTSLPFTTTIWQDTGFYIALVVAVFTVLFGTRRIDATENHQGIMLAIAFESIVKLFAFLVVGLFTVYFLYDGMLDLWQQANDNPITQKIIEFRQPSSIYLTQALLGMIAILFLPRQFHVLVVENRTEQELMKSRWIFPGYLLLINFFILPVALAGNLYFQGSDISAEYYTILLPLSEGHPLVALLVFIGGISAATSMIIVSTIVLSTMISNEIIVPFAVKYFSTKLSKNTDFGKQLVNIRRILILIILLFSYGYYRKFAIGEQLATTGLLSLALIAQLAPALIAGIYWNRCTQKATVAALIGGFIVWAYTLLLPLLSSAGIFPTGIIEFGPFGFALLKPTQLFGLYGFDTLTHGLTWSLSVNIFLLFYFSLHREQSISERIQASQFLSGTSANEDNFTLQEKQIETSDLVLLARRFMGDEQSEKAFAQFCREQQIQNIEQADKRKLIRYTEKLLQAIIGSTSTRLVFESLANNHKVPFEDVFHMIDEAADVLLFNRELLQSAIENISHGISVIDKDLKLVAWNKQYVKLFNYPDNLIRVGRPIEELVRYNAEQGMMGKGDIEALVAKRLEFMRAGSPHVYERNRQDGLVLETRGNPMPGGGFVTSFIDITEFRQQQKELEKINENLENRVISRTQELEELNQRLLEAKSMAELANHSKTRFLAAASHDVLQPLNAASLFSATLFEQVDGERQKRLTLRIQQSLHSAEQLLKDLIEISKLDAGNIKPNPVNFSISELMEQLTREFRVLAKEKGIILKTVYCHKTTQTDRTMLRRVLQNLLINAIKHSKSTKILFGCRRRDNGLSIHVIDQGHGIAKEKQQTIFKEFVQLDSDKFAVEGHGLGLAIVSRILNVLKMPLQLYSEVNKGSNFFVTLPLVENSPSESPQPKVIPVSFAGKHSSDLDRLIVCIDNEQDILDGMLLLLNSWGYKNVITSLDGVFLKEHKLKAEHIALILADYHLEKNRTGIEVINELRSIAKWDIPSVIISADRSDEIKKEIQENSIFLIHKPIKPLSLRTLLNRLMKI